MHRRGRRTLGAALGAVVLTGAVAPALAQADSSAPSWNCRASLAYVTNTLGIPQLARIEPFAANGNTTDPLSTDRPACADDSQAVPHIGPFNAPIDVEADAVVARTDLNPDVGAARDQTATAAVKAADATVTVGGGALVSKVGAIFSAATVDCVAGRPVFQSKSLVESISVNGQAIPIDDGTIQQISTVVNGSPLSALIRLTVNQAYDSGDAASDTQGRVQQALKVELLNAPGAAPVATAVLGEAKVTRQGRTCDADNTVVTPPPSPNDPGTPTTPATPAAPTTPSIIYVPVNTGGSTGVGSSGNPTTIQLNGQNGGCGKLSMYFIPSRKQTMSSEYGHRVVTRGRIVSCGGKSIVGGRIDVFHIIKGKKVRIRKTGIRSRALGRLTLILPLNLTTRKLIFEYRGNLASSKITSRQTLSLTVRYKGKVITKEPGPKRTAQF
jgi:hypothetical protein